MASQSLFKRDWRVVVDTLDISGLEVSFHVEKNTKAEPNKATLQIFNLSADHVAQITKQATAKQSTGVRVDISAGYVGNVPLIFRGDAREIYTEHDTATRTTRLSAHDGGRAYRESRITQSFAPGTSVASLIQACANAMGIGIGNAVEASSGQSLAVLGQTYPNGVVLDGNAAKQLDRLTFAAGLSWSIQNGVLQLQPIGEPLETTAVRIASDTGMVGSPSVDIESATAGTKKKKSGALVKVKTLMIPGLNPGRKVVLDSVGFSGGYMVAQADYVGDTAGNDWNVNLKLRPY